MRDYLLMLYLLWFAILPVASCSGGNNDPVINKPASGSKQDAVDRLCRLVGEHDGCDICGIQSWYDDGECDDFCEDPDPDCEDPGPDYNMLAPVTDEQWESYSREERLEIVELSELLEEGEWVGMKTITFHEPDSIGRPVDISLIEYAPYREYADDIDVFMQDNCYMDVMDIDGYHSVVGEPEIYWLWIFVRESDHKVFGGGIGYYQQGCDMPDFDGDVRYFETEQEAKAAGCDYSDVNWQAHAVFDFDASSLRYDTYMDWSGY